MGFGGCFGCPDESVGMKMGVLSFPGERIFGYELPPGGKFCITGVFLLGEGVFPYLKGMSLWGCCCIALFDLGRGGSGLWRLFVGVESSYSLIFVIGHGGTKILGMLVFSMLGM